VNEIVVVEEYHSMINKEEAIPSPFNAVIEFRRELQRTTRPK
jgi:hypothetical protein